MKRIWTALFYIVIAFLIYRSKTSGDTIAALSRRLDALTPPAKVALPPAENIDAYATPKAIEPERIENGKVH